MRVIVDYTALLLVRATLWLLNRLPMPARLAFVGGLIRLIAACVPSFRSVSLKNLEVAFPDESPEARRQIYRQSIDSLARVLVDFARLHTLDAQWIRNHVECPFLPRFLEIKTSNPQTGILIATGHLGSFELMAHSIAVLGHPLSFVVRNFKLPKLDHWWTRSREKSGNEVIRRQGAVKHVLANLQNGKDVALLFDQNVKRNHALFVPWFGKTAATTMTIGLAAVRTRAPVVVASMRYLANDHYRIEATECPCDDIYDRDDFSTEQKMLAVTERATRLFEEMIRRYPEGWFWMHRRWKTQPEGQPEAFYSI